MQGSSLVARAFAAAGVPTLMPEDSITEWEEGLASSGWYLGAAAQGCGNYDRPMLNRQEPSFHEPDVLTAAVELALATDRSRPHPGDQIGDVEPIQAEGSGALATLSELAPLVVGTAAQLGHPGYFAHMDPPTPSIAQAGALWSAMLNQNLLHADTAPVAKKVEAAVVNWFAPCVGMTGGHMVPGSSLANLTALWTAREVRGVSILGLEFVECPVDGQRLAALPDDLGPLDNAALVLTAGTTSTGSIDDLSLGDPAWLHVDAAWAGPLRLSNLHADVLAGIDRADSVVVSAHKWLYQPKESALGVRREDRGGHEARLGVRSRRRCRRAFRAVGTERHGSGGLAAG